MNYPQVSIKDAATELNRLDAAIQSGMRQTVSDAIRAGEILGHVKNHFEHGEFLPWIRENCEFSQKTAWNYMAVHRHSNKLVSVTNLQDAYQKVAQIETAEKQSEDRKAKDRVSEYRETGGKPEGWRRGTDDKLAQKEDERQARIDEARDRVRAESKERDEKESFDDAEDALFQEAAERLVATTEKRQGFKERIKLSQAGESDSFIDALMDYLNELESDSRRIEACQNIIKVCRNVAAELQAD